VHRPAPPLRWETGAGTGFHQRHPAAASAPMQNERLMPAASRGPGETRYTMHQSCREGILRQRTPSAPRCRVAFKTGAVGGKGIKPSPLSVGDEGRGKGIGTVGCAAAHHPTLVRLTDTSVHTRGGVYPPAGRFHPALPPIAVRSKGRVSSPPALPSAGQVLCNLERTWA